MELCLIYVLSDLVYLGTGIVLPYNHQEFQYNLNFTFIFLLSLCWYFCNLYFEDSLHVVLFTIHSLYQNSISRSHCLVLYCIYANISWAFFFVCVMYQVW